MRFVTILLTVGMLSAFDNSRCGCLAKTYEYQKNFTPFKMLQYVLNNENKWEDILKEKVKTQVFVRHGAKNMYDPLIPANILDNENSVVHIRNALISVVYDYPLLGSMVIYGTRLLYTSIMCNMTRHMAFLIDYVYRLIDTQIESHFIMSEVTKTKQIIAIFIDKLSTSDQEQSLAHRMYWLMQALMQDNTVHRVREANYSDNSNIKLKNLKNEFVTYLDFNCEPYKPTVAFLKAMGMDSSNMLLGDDVLNVTVTGEMLLNVGKIHRKYLKDLYNNLGIQALSKDLWSQVYYTGKKLLPSDEMEKTNAPITHQVISNK